MTMVSSMVCGLCGREAAETLITRARWESFEDGDGQTRHFCPSCADRHRRRKERLIAALEQEEVEGPAEENDAGGGDNRRGGFLRTLVDSVVGR